MTKEVLDELNGFLAATRNVGDPIVIGRRFDSHLRAHGLGAFSLDLIGWSADAPDGMAGLWKCPAEWVEHYFQQRYVEIDPFIVVGRQQRRAFNWFEVLAYHELSEPAWRMIREAAAFGIGIGMTIPIHRPDGRYAAVSITADQSIDPTANGIRAHARLLNMLAFALYERAAHLVRGRQINLAELDEAAQGGAAESEAAPAEPVPVVPFLSRLELDCLAWLTGGLSVWDISERVGESASRTRQLIATAERRLAVSNPAHAIVRAVDLGILRP